MAGRKLHGLTASAGGLVFLDQDVVVEAPIGPDDLCDRLADQREVMLLKPLEIEPAGKLDGQFDLVIECLNPDGLKGLEPRLEALTADIVPDDIQAFIPD